MSVIAGKNLVVTDNSQEKTAGRVTLETEQSFACEQYILLIEYHHLLGNSDRGFQVSMETKFRVYDIVTDEYFIPQTSGYAVTKMTRKFPMGNYNMFYPVNTPVKNQFIKIDLQWFGFGTNLADLKIHFYPESRI